MQKFIDILSPRMQRPIQARYCVSFLCRLRGLILRKDIEPYEGLLLVQPRDSRIDSSIHMLGVFTDLAIIWISSNRIVVDTRLARAWRLAYSPRQKAKYVLEAHPDRLIDFTIGDYIEFGNEHD